MPFCHGNVDFISLFKGYLVVTPSPFKLKVCAQIKHTLNKCTVLLYAYSIYVIRIVIILDDSVTRMQSALRSNLHLCNCSCQMSHDMTIYY